MLSKKISRDTSTLSSFLKVFFMVLIFEIIAIQQVIPEFLFRIGEDHYTCANIE